VALTGSVSSLSGRGARAADSPLRIDHDAFRQAAANRYHPESNPEGALPLNIAENRLGWPDLRGKIEEVSRSARVPDWVSKYASHRGSLPFRAAAAGFLSAHLTGRPVDPDHLGVSAGATGVIEMTAFLLADPGDVAVIPAPCYPVYRKDIGNMAGVERYDLVTHEELSEVAHGPVLDVGHLDRALQELSSQGRRFRMLILTAPDNPTGAIYTAERLERIADWCIEHEIHLVVNEIYGLSLIDTSHPALEADYVDPEPFISFGQIMDDRRSDRLHLIYALSKDLGISGFRTGLVYTHNAAFIRAYENLNLTHTVSNHTQWLLAHVLSDRDFMTGYVQRNQARLTEAYAIVVEAMRRAGIPYVPSRGSLFCWIDLSELLEDHSEAGELALWQRLFDETGVLLTPGVGFGHAGHGRFRVVYPCVEVDELRVAMKRLEGFVAGLRRA
jgi:aspartate/methionine/tyrosine aminotransferase